jgi:hypothetical protein
MPQEPCGNDECVDKDELARLHEQIEEHFDFLDSIQNDLLHHCRDCVLDRKTMCRHCGVSDVIDELEEALKARP